MNAKTINDALHVEGAPHLGSIVWWYLDHVYTTSAQLHQECQAVGLPTDWVPADYDESAAFTRAWHNVRNRSASTEGFMIRPYKNGSRRADIMRVERDDSGGVLRAITSVYVQLENSKAEIHLTSEASERALFMARDIRKEYDRLRGFIDSERLRYAIVKFISDHCYGCALRERGGVYWVPSQYYDTLKRFRSVCEKIGGASVSVVEVFDVAASMKALREAAKNRMATDLAELRLRVSEINEASRSHGLKSRLAEIKELRERAELYRDCLQLSIAEIESELATLDQVVMQELEARQ